MACPRHNLFRTPLFHRATQRALREYRSFQAKRCPLLTAHTNHLLKLFLCDLRGMDARVAKALPAVLT